MGTETIDDISTIDLLPLFSLEPGFHIAVSGRAVSQSVDRRCYWHAYDDMGTFFWWCHRRPHSIADVPVEMQKVEISSTFENVPDASPSCPRRCWDVSVAFDDMETWLKWHWKSLMLYMHKTPRKLCSPMLLFLRKSF